MKRSLSLRFLGAAGAVTGSKHLISAGDEKLLIDCGMFQGLKELRLLNWEKLPINEEDINFVALTHAHIDHTGYLPRLIRNGFAGKVFATSATCDLLRILLPDAARLQKEQADDANEQGFSKHSPALPLFDEDDVRVTLERMVPVSFGKTISLSEVFKVTYFTAGHILGSSVVAVDVDLGEGESRRILFSGDLGRYDAPILPDPTGIERADYLVTESTYGDREHEPADDSLDKLARIINESCSRGGVLVAPAFAIGRTQLLLYLIRQLEGENKIPSLPVFVDSPMAAKACNYYDRHHEEHDADMNRLEDQGIEPMHPQRLRFCATRDESKAVNRLKSRAIIISASGMITGGRVLHHALHRLPHAQNTFLLCGFQAAGTRGRQLAEGAESVKIQGMYVPVRARIEQLHGFSAHADASEIIRWARALKSPPIKTFIVHGEPTASLAMAAKFREQLGFETHVPVMGEEVVLG